MGVKREPTGPLITSTLFQINECIFWGRTRPKTIAPQDDDERYVVTNFDRLDLIAARRLGDSQLGWVILARNDMRLAPNDLVPGNTIFIPTRQSLRQRGIVR